MSLARLAPERHDTLEDVPEPAETPVLFGHGEEADRLAAAYRAGRLPHALILSGPQGIGKATFAFHLANHLLAHPDPASAPERLAAPDPASALHRQIAAGAHPAVLYMARPLDEKKGTFRTAVTVDEIRRVGRFLGLTAHDGGWRIVIVDPADDMNQNAANALLKNLEEPPARTLFILISHAAGGLLPTIRSRCRMVRLQPLAADELAAVLGRIGIGEVPPRLAGEAAGSVREAILLARHGGLETAEAIEAAAAAPTFDAAAAGRLADRISGRGQGTAFSLFNRRLLDHAATMAARAAEAGDLQRADRLSAFWQDAAQAIAETDTYNLDKRQHVFGLLLRMRAAMRAGA